MRREVADRSIFEDFLKVLVFRWDGFEPSVGRLAKFRDCDGGPERRECLFDKPVAVVRRCGSYQDSGAEKSGCMVIVQKYEEEAGELSLLTGVSSSSFSGQAASLFFFRSWRWCRFRSFFRSLAHVTVPLPQSMQQWFRWRNFCPSTISVVVVGARRNSSAG